MTLKVIVSALQHAVQLLPVAVTYMCKSHQCPFDLLATSAIRSPSYTSACQWGEGGGPSGEGGGQEGSGLSKRVSMERQPRRRYVAKQTAAWPVLAGSAVFVKRPNSRPDVSSACVLVETARAGFRAHWSDSTAARSACKQLWQCC